MSLLPVRAAGSPSRGRRTFLQPQLRSSAGWEGGASGADVSGKSVETGPPFGDVGVGLVVSLRFSHLGERDSPHQMPQRGEQKSPVIWRLAGTMNDWPQDLQARTVPGVCFRFVGILFPDSGVPWYVGENVGHDYIRSRRRAGATTTAGGDVRWSPKQLSATSQRASSNKMITNKMRRAPSECIEACK